MRFLLIVTLVVLSFAAFTYANEESVPAARQQWKWVQEAESIIQGSEPHTIKEQRLQQLIQKAGLTWPFFFEPYPSRPYPTDQGGLLSGFLGGNSGYNNFLGGLFGNNYPPLFTYYPQNYYGYLYPPGAQPFFPNGAPKQQ
ncbi:hypothetical protein PPL_01644 [Heterostelium album PN500]|uniref:Uncharacterized protein n=1 Tax=Heterostelium pallidum (strain ATCC 26659 / Pp 5 / PN500) TaxID=670386 RepID=D3B030_HETP5|nr:hypothetical protein PPL_01644 [Heterostelium album PN500]EFA84654.1 hypothetical protein PPL_01644 [Heterostelium album PN500]|eukprot:XP_020436767.1 hypothetical protein PPL_01644 [Heterostelium album PN500]